MPNWCSTRIEVVNPDSEILRNLESEFNNAFNMNKFENGFGKTWLGNILGYLGYSVKDVMKGDIRCRGEVSWMERSGNVLKIDTETAWTPMLEPILKMVEKYAPDSEIIFYAVEEGCGILATNDDSVVGKIHVDVYDSLPDELAWLEEANDEYYVKDEFLRYIAESMGWDIPEDEIEKKVDDELSGFSYSEWEYSEIGDWQ